jgi:peptidoglycan/xylan/chitin deacetylase (PgdA/CDA1 family)
LTGRPYRRGGSGGVLSDTGANIPTSRGDRDVSAFLLPSLALAAAATVAAVAPEASSARPAASDRVVYLTFDDGPDRRYTPQVLDLLRRYDAHATFFAVGRSVEAEPALARRIVRDGHMLGNHTFSHRDLTTLGASAFFAEVDRAHAAIRRATGLSARWLRPPYGAVSASVRSLAAARGYRLALWDVDPQDWRRPGAAAIAASVLAHVRPGANVLLHDGGGDRSQTVEALGRILPALAARGYRVAALA